MLVKRALVAAVSLWAATLLLWIVFSIAIRYMGVSSDFSLNGVESVAVILLTFVCSWYYFNSSRVSRTSIHGLKLGFFFIVIGFLLDILVFTPFLLSTNSLDKIYTYYQSADFFLMSVFTLLIPSLIGRFYKQLR